MEAFFQVATLCLHFSM